MGTKYLPRRLGQHLADAKELTAPRTWNSNSVGVSHGKTDIWSMILPWVYNLYTCDNATWKVYKFPHWMPHNKAICSLYYTICTNCIQLWKGLCTLRVHSITRIKMRVHAVYLNWRFGVRLKMGKSIRGGDTQPPFGSCVVGIADAADFRERKSLSAMQKALTDCRSSQVSGNYMELLKPFFEVRFRRDFGIIWCAHVLFTASKSMNLVWHSPWFTT